MKPLASAALLLALTLGALPALADLLPPPCMNKSVGDACTDITSKPGTCQQGTMGLSCVTTGTTTTTTGTGGSAGTGGSSSSGSSSGGCAVAPRGEGAGGLLLSGLALAAVCLVRRRRR